MITNPHNSNDKAFPYQSAEETLRLIASLPAPSGLEERVHSALESAPRRGRVLAWPEGFRPQSGWMRTAAAAAIVFVVAGGGWGVYTRVGQNRPAKVLVMPHIAAPGGFSGANAVRTPQTLSGPTIAPAPAQTATTQPAPPKTAKKPAVKIAPGSAMPGSKPAHAASQQ